MAFSCPAWPIHPLLRSSSRYSKCGALLLLLPALVVIASCAHSGTSEIPAENHSAAARTSQVAVDRHDPKSVLLAYFDAWAQNDWPRQDSFEDRNYPNAVHDPVESVTILDMRRLEHSTATQVIYAVSFEIVLKGQGASMEDGRHNWTFELTWDPARDSWLITNYGFA